jgi:hypothetical protein
MALPPILCHWPLMPAPEKCTADPIALLRAPLAESRVIGGFAQVASLLGERLQQAMR